MSPTYEVSWIASGRGKRVSTRVPREEIPAILATLPHINEWTLTLVPEPKPEPEYEYRLWYGDDRQHPRQFKTMVDVLRFKRTLTFPEDAVIERRKITNDWEKVG